MVVSSPITGAAIIGGELILSLPTGEIINCGLVQGPPGPKGSIGAPGSKGDPGLDGCTLLHGPGFPDPGLGKDGDFYWMVSPEVAVFGPKTGSGGWGSPVFLSRPITASKADYKPIAGQSGGGGADGGTGPSKVYTNQVIATGSGRLAKNKATVAYDGGPNGILKPSNPMDYQSNINAWVVAALEQLEDAIPVAVVDSPRAGNYEGELGYYEGNLYIWIDGNWETLSTKGGAILGVTAPVGRFDEGALWFCTLPDDLTLYVYDGAVWVPAAPPVSLDGVQSAIASIDEQLLKVNANVAMNKSELDEKALDIQLDQERQDEKIAELEGEVDDLKPTIERGEWVYNSAPDNANTPAPGEYHAYVVISDDYCKQKLSECLLNAAGNPEAASNCNRENGDCLEKIDTIDPDVPWHDVRWLVIHRNDLDGRQHVFGDVVPGMYIEAINADGTGHGLYQIVAKSLTGVKCGFNVEPVHSEGHPNGKAIIKVFSMAEAANPDDYVRKLGDTMNGQLQIRPEQPKTNSLVVFAGKGTPDDDKTAVFAVTNTRGHEILRVHNHGRIRAGSREIDYTAEYDSDLVTKKYVDQLRSPARLAWRWLGAIDGATAPEDGGFYKSGDYLRVSFKTDNNIDLGDNLFPDTNFLSTQYGPFGTIWKYNKEDNKWQLMRQIRVDGFRWNYNNHMEYNLSSSHGRSFDDFVVGETYYVTIAGFF